MARPFRNKKRRGGVTSYIRRVEWPGKFEGETYCSLWAYDQIGDGFGDECESEGDGGASFTLIEGPFSKWLVASGRDSTDPLNRAERRFIRRQAGFILHERSDGFVAVHWYDDPKELGAAWGRVVREMEEFHGEFEDEDEDEAA